MAGTSEYRDYPLYRKSPVYREYRDYLTYQDNEYLTEIEADYLGYDMEDNDVDPDITFGFSYTEKQDREEEKQEKDKDADTDDSDDDYLEDAWLDYDGRDENAEGYRDTVRDSDRHAEETDEYGECDDENWYSEDETEEAPETYILDGREFKDALQYDQKLYERDLAKYKRLKPEEEHSLAVTVRKGILCFILTENKEVLKKYPFELVMDNASMLRRLKPTDEEKTWIKNLNREDTDRVIGEGKAAHDKMICCNLPLVMSEAGKKYKRIEYMDRVQEGNMGLIRAVQLFDPYHGNRFTTYAISLIQHAISDYAKMLKMQTSYSGKEKCYVAKEKDVEAVCKHMGGEDWVRLVAIDTEQDHDRIRKQIAVMLEMKESLEYAANNVLFGEQKFDESILEYAENNESETYWQKQENEKPEKKTIELKTKHLKKLLDKSCPYTKEDAIDELRNLIRKGHIWPERYSITQARLWGMGADREFDDSKLREEAGLLTDYDGYLDTSNPTETIAMLLDTGYVSLRHRDILEHARLSYEYYIWLSEIIDLTVRERVDADKDEDIIFEGLTSGDTYRKMARKYHIGQGTIRERKYAILSRIWDQVVENSNRDNGEALIKCLRHRYQMWYMRWWKTKMINKMVTDHFTEKGRFKLRSRGAATPPRPLQEVIAETCRTTCKVLAPNIESVINELTETSESLNKSLSELYGSINTLLSSDAFQEHRKDWYESGFLEEIEEIEERLGDTDVFADQLESLMARYEEAENEPFFTR